jgi:hypothetical protein
MDCSDETHLHVWSSHGGEAVSANSKKSLLCGGSNAWCLNSMPTKMIMGTILMASATSPRTIPKIVSFQQPF